MDLSTLRNTGGVGSAMFALPGTKRLRLTQWDVQTCDDNVPVVASDSKRSSTLSRMSSKIWQCGMHVVAKVLALTQDRDHWAARSVGMDRPLL